MTTLDGHIQKNDGIINTMSPKSATREPMVRAVLHIALYAVSAPSIVLHVPIYQKKKLLVPVEVEVEVEVEVKVREKGFSTLQYPV